MAKEKERKLCVCRKHWTCYLLSGLLAVFFVLYALAGNADAATRIASVLVALVIVLCIFIDYKTDYLALTETRIVGHKGFIWSKTLSTPLTKVQSVSLSNGLFGKLLKYHTITIDNAGTGMVEYVFKRMAKAQDFVDMVNERI